MSEDQQRKPWHKEPSAIDPEQERISGELLASMHARLAIEGPTPLSKAGGRPIHATPEEIDEALRKAREEGDGEKVEYDPIMDYCSY